MGYIGRNDNLKDLKDLFSLGVSAFNRWGTEREFFIVNLLVRIHFIIEMIWWTGLAPWEF